MGTRLRICDLSRVTFVRSVTVSNLPVGFSILYATKKHQTRQPDRDPACDTGRIDLHLTNDAQADRLLSDDPFALLVGMLLEQLLASELVVTSCTSVI